MKEEKNQLRIIVRGEVQGVFFRATTQELAQKLGVKGTVKNLSDGAVEIIAQAAPEAINQLLDQLAAPSGPGRVDSMEKISMKSDVIFSDFNILR